jgi:hypothetical protein
LGRYSLTGTRIGAERFVANTVAIAPAYFEAINGVASRIRADPKCLGKRLDPSRAAEARQVTAVTNDAALILELLNEVSRPRDIARRGADDLVGHRSLPRIGAEQ